MHVLQKLFLFANRIIKHDIFKQILQSIEVLAIDQFPMVSFNQLKFVIDNYLDSLQSISSLNYIVDQLLTLIF